MGLFWQGWWSARSVVVVEVNGYTIEPGANLEGANLEGANLTGADLSWAFLEGANLEEAKAKKRDPLGDTIWPEGFDQVAAGVVFD